MPKPVRRLSRSTADGARTGKSLFAACLSALSTCSENQESVSFLENRDIEGDFDREAEADDITSVPFVMEDGNPCGTRNLMERFPPGRVSKDFVEIV